MHSTIHSSSVTPFELTWRSILCWMLLVYSFKIDASPAMGVGIVITTSESSKIIKKKGGYFQLRNESGNPITINGDFAGLYSEPVPPQTTISGTIPESARKTGALLRIIGGHQKVTERLISPVLEKKPHKLRNVFLRYTALGNLEPEFSDPTEASLWNTAPLV